METQTDDKGITIYNKLRQIINKFPDYTIRNVLRVLYLFGTETEELIGRGKDRKTVTGDDFYIAEINARARNDIGLRRNLELNS